MNKHAETSVSEDRNEPAAKNAINAIRLVDDNDTAVALVRNLKESDDTITGDTMTVAGKDFSIAVAGYESQQGQRIGLIINSDGELIVATLLNLDQAATLASQMQMAIDAVRIAEVDGKRMKQDD